MLDKEETPKETVLITGAGQRVGLHCAQRLVADGYQVVITCRRLRPEWEVKPLKGIEVMLADFSSEQGINAFIRVLQERAHSLRAIIHNASTWIDDDLVDGPAFQRLCMVHMQAPYMINMACASLFPPTLWLTSFTSLTTMRSMEQMTTLPTWRPRQDWKI
jgi:dihydromonapterin reductase/dihydrofolate reductase